MADKKNSKIWTEKPKESHTWQVDGKEMRKPNWIIFLEVVKEHFGVMYSSGFIFLISLLPGALILYVGINENASLFCLLGGILAGLLGGPTLAGTFDTVLRCLREEPGYWRSYYKKAWKQNWKQGMKAGAVIGALLGLWGWMAHLMYTADVDVPATVWISLGISALLLMMVVQYYFAQMVLLTLSSSELLRNSCLMTVGYLPQSLIAGIVAAIYWGTMAVGLPYTLIFLVTTGGWFPVLIGVLEIYPPINKTHHIDEKQELLDEEKYNSMF